MSTANALIVERDLVVIGASAGGVQAIEELVSGLPGDFPAALMIVLHLPPDAPSVLPMIIARAGKLPADHAVDRGVIEIGKVYVAPPDRHLVVERGRMRVTRGPRENGHRPAVDALFRSAARAYGPQVVGVVLTGSLDDGTAGLRAIKQHGGLAIVQDPADALSPGMPRSALANVAVDHCVRLKEIAPLLSKVVREPLEATALRTHEAAPDDGPLLENDPQRVQELATHFSCPDCNGMLYELEDGEQYRCRLGHLYLPEALLRARDNDVETALWAAVRSLEESAILARRIGRSFGCHQMERFETRAAEAERYAALVRRMLRHSAGESHGSAESQE